MRNFREYEIWQIGMDLVVEVYEKSKELPKSEEFGLKGQMRRSAVSMPSNIAEGCSRQTDKAFARFLEISLGSAFELETQLLVGIRTGQLQESDLQDLLGRLNMFQRKTNSLIGKLKR